MGDRQPTGVWWTGDSLNVYNIIIYRRIDNTIQTYRGIELVF